MQCALSGEQRARRVFLTGKQQLTSIPCAEGLAADREEGQGAKLAHQKAVVTYLSEVSASVSHQTGLENLCGMTQCPLCIGSQRLQDLNQTFVDMKSEKKKAGMFRMLQR